MRADDVDLIRGIALPGIAYEALPLKKQGGIFIVASDRDLVEGVVGLAPVGGGPVLVEVGNGSVLVGEPRVELGFGFGIEGNLTVFVVQLPADDVGVVAEMDSHLLGDGAGELAVALVGEGELSAVAVLGTTAVLINAKSLRIFGCQPGWRRGGGCAENDADVVLRGEGNGAFEPPEFVMPFGGLHGAPGKLADADEVDVRGFHEGEVGLPLGFRPLFGIPGGSEEQRWLVGVGGGLR